MLGADSDVPVAVVARPAGGGDGPVGDTAGHAGPLKAVARGAVDTSSASPDAAPSSTLRSYGTTGDADGSVTTGGAPFNRPMYATATVSNEERAMAIDDRVARAAAYVDAAFTGSLIAGANYPLAMRVYQNVKPLKHLVLAMYLFIAFFEQPSWCFTTDCGDPAVYLTSQLPRLDTPQSVMVELLCLMLIAALFALRVAANGVRQAFAIASNRVTAVCLVVAIVDVVISFPLPGHFRVSPYIRPVMVASMVPTVRDVFRQIVLLLPGCVDVLVLTAMMVFFYGMFGVFLWRTFDVDRDEANKYFPSYGEAFFHLLVTLTTANFPDVMMPAYTHYRASFLFFCSFLVIGLFLFMNLLLATVFDKYKTQLKLDFQAFKTRRRKFLFHAFRLLDSGDETVPAESVRQLLYELNHYGSVPYVEDFDMDNVLATMSEYTDVAPKSAGARAAAKAKEFASAVKAAAKAAAASASPDTTERLTAGAGAGAAAGSGSGSRSGSGSGTGLGTGAGAAAPASAGGASPAAESAGESAATPLASAAAAVTGRNADGKVTHLNRRQFSQIVEALKLHKEVQEHEVRARYMRRHSFDEVRVADSAGGGSDSQHERSAAALASATSVSMVPRADADGEDDGDAADDGSVLTDTSDMQVVATGAPQVRQQPPVHGVPGGATPGPDMPLLFGETSRKHSKRNHLTLAAASKAAAAAATRCGCIPRSVSCADGRNLWRSEFGRMRCTRPYWGFTLAQALWWEALVIILVVVNAVVSISAYGGHTVHKPVGVHVGTSGWVEFTFTCLFFVESLARAILITPRGVMRSWLLTADAIVAVGGMVAELVALGSLAVPMGLVVRYVVLARLTRVARLAVYVPRFQLIFVTLGSLVRPIGRLLGAQLLLMYMFNIVGIQLFGGLIYKTNPALAGSQFAESGYWANNFNDFGSGMVVLFELMIVNNWQVVQSGFILATNGYYHFFFVAYWLTMVVVVVNLVVAYVLDSYDVESKRAVLKDPRSFSAKGKWGQLRGVVLASHFASGGAHKPRLVRGASQYYDLAANDEE